MKRVKREEKYIERERIKLREKKIERDRGRKWNK